MVKAASMSINKRAKRISEIGNVLFKLTAGHYTPSMKFGLGKIECFSFLTRMEIVKNEVYFI